MENLGFIILQITDTVAVAAENVPSEIRLSLLDLLIKGGYVMLPIILCSFVAVYIFTERYLTIRRATRIEKNFMNQIKDFVLSGNVDAAKELCVRTDNPMARMIEKGISKIGKPLKNIDVAIENVGQIEIYKLEKKVNALATISGVAPMLGFLGTVTGMIQGFYNMSMAGNNVEPGLLAGGIYEALITTAAGLMVGIPAYVGYNMLVTMIGKVVHQMEATTMDFIDLLQEPV